MRTAIDSNVISALWSSEPLASKMVDVLADAQSHGGLVICAPVYCELLAHPKAERGFVDAFLSDTNVTIEFLLDESVWREAGTRFADYAERRRHSGGSGAKRLLADFIIGAHARTRADRLLTLDRARYELGFPDLCLASPAL